MVTHMPVASRWLACMPYKFPAPKALFQNIFFSSSGSAELLLSRTHRPLAKGAFSYRAKQREHERPRYVIHTHAERLALIPPSVPGASTWACVSRGGQLGLPPAFAFATLAAFGALAALVPVSLAPARVGVASCPN